MARLVYSKCKLDDLLWALGGFAEEALPERPRDTVRRMLSYGRTPREIAEFLGCTQNAVEAARWRMGIRLQVHKLWSSEDVRMLVLMRGSGSTFTKIARALGRTYHQCAAQYYREQAKKNKRPPLGQTVPKAEATAVAA